MPARAGQTASEARAIDAEHVSESSAAPAADGAGARTRVALQARNLRRYAFVPFYPLVWPLAYLMPRRRGLWAFAYAHGFKDNPRYLFEHVVAAAPRGVRAVWFAQGPAERDQVQAAGFDAVNKRSPKGWWLQLRAGTVVLGFGPSDLNRPLVGRATIVQTWHGAPFKRIHADFPEGDKLIPGTGRLIGLVNDLARRATNATRSRVRMIPSQSELVASRFQTAFGIGPDRTPVVGTPRADITGRTGPEAEAEAARVRRAALPPELGDTAKFVLYAPTWRDGSSEAFLADGFDLPALEALLEAHDAALLIRMHPQGDTEVFARAGAGGGKRVVLGRPADLDVNVLLRAVDILITDYSAISVDYALLGRPILYLMPDLEDYERGRGMYESPALLTGGLHCRNWTELHELLAQAFVDPAPFVAAAEGVRSRYFTHLDTESCARTTKVMLELAGLTGGGRS
ncbi:MAG: CDP-glycerol glycerophosphotransferase family protein [Actinomycetota bacterium]|nr:CDP-glycerol glycerophosphotransferase family protein [Actinomycetota bacterium]